MRTAAVLSLSLLTAAAPAGASTLLLTCGGTRLSIDIGVPVVTVHYPTGFSIQYKNGSETSSYKFTDGSATPYTSTQVVRVSEAEIAFSDRTRTGQSDSVVENVINRKTLVWRADENGKVRDTKCVWASTPQAAP